MPDYDPPAVLEPASFTLSLNENKNADQASETYTMRAAEGAVLGGQGETLAFAKPQFNPAEYKPLEQEKRALERRAASLSTESEAGKEWAGLKGQIDSLPDRIQMAESRLEQARNSVSDAEQSGNQEELAECQNQLVENQQTLDGLLAERNQVPAKQERLAELEKHADVKELLAVREAQLTNKEKLNIMFNTANASSPLFNSAAMAEPQNGDDRALLTRSVASYQVDQLLGTNVIAEEKVAQAPDGRLMGVSVQADGAQITGKYQEKDCFLQANYSDPRIQKGLADLEAVDYITGQIDRHNGNIFVDPSTGKVTGIDNDLAFPEKDREVMLENDAVLPEKAVVGLPRQMSQETADKIQALTPERLAGELRRFSNPDGTGKLSEAEIGGAVERLQNLQAAIKNPNSGLQIVRKFDDTTYAAAIKQQKEHMVAQKKKGTLDINPDQPDFQDIQNVRDVKSVPKASYLGAAVAQGRSYELLKGQVEQGVEFGVRPAGTVDNKARVNPEFAAYKRAEASTKKAMAASPELIENHAVRQEVTSTNRELGALQAKLDDYQKQLDKLSQPSRLDQAKALLRRGGVDNAREHLMDKRAAVLQQMKTQQEKLDKALDKAVEPLKTDLYLAAREQSAANPAVRNQSPEHAPKIDGGPDLPRAGSVADSLKAKPKVQNGGENDLKTSREIDNGSVGNVTKLKEKFEQMNKEKAAGISAPARKTPAPGPGVT